MARAVKQGKEPGNTGLQFARIRDEQSSQQGYQAEGIIAGSIRRAGLPVVKKGGCPTGENAGPW